MMRVSNTVKMILAIIALLTGLGMIGGVWWITRPAKEPPSQARQAEELQLRRDLLAKQIATLISVEEEGNRVAIIRAENDLRDTFKTYADRTPQFAEAVTGLKNRLTIVFRTLKDRWSKTNEVQKLTADLFAQHVVSDQQNVDDLNKIISQLRNDLAANRNGMLSEAALRIRQADLGIPDLNLSQDAMVERLSGKVQETLSQTVRKSPWDSLLSFSGSAVAGGGTQLLVAQVIRIAWGSMAIDALTGGGFGSFVPGVGNAVGVVVAFAVGVAADYWMSKRMTTKIEEEACRTLDAMREEIWSNPTEGLKVKFDHLVELTRDMHAQVLHNAVSEKKS